MCWLHIHSMPRLLIRDPLSHKQCVWWSIFIHLKQHGHIFRPIAVFHGHDKHLKDNRLCGTFEAWSVSHSAALLLATYKVHFSQAAHKHVRLRIILGVLQVKCRHLLHTHTGPEWSTQFFWLSTNFENYLTSRKVIKIWRISLIGSLNMIGKSGCTVSVQSCSQHFSPFLLINHFL